MLDKGLIVGNITEFLNQCCKASAQNYDAVRLCLTATVNLVMQQLYQAIIIVFAFKVIRRKNKTTKLF